MKTLTILLSGFLGLAAETLPAEPEPVRFAIVGLVHDHARGFIPAARARKDNQTIEPGYAMLPAIDVDVPDGVAWKLFEDDSRR